MYLGFIALDAKTLINDCSLKCKENCIFKLDSLLLEPDHNNYIPDFCFPIESESDCELLEIKYTIIEGDNATSYQQSIYLKEILSKYPETSEIRIGFNTGGLLFVWLYSCSKCVLITPGDIQTHCIGEDLKHFTYKYLPILVESQNDESSCRFYIEEALYDGTHDKLKDTNLMKYHDAGKPQKLKIQLKESGNETSAFFWFDRDQITSIFNKFYGAHPETKSDFIIRIDAKNNKYELALYRQGLKEPVVIPESAYQLIVFKNKFEDYRSDNYNQPTGAWIW